MLLSKLLLILVLISLVACQTPSANSNSPAVAEPETRLDTQLVLNNAIIEQSNKRDNTVWKIKANNITYNEDRRNATLDQVVGNLLQDKTIILKISAQKGEVRENGNIILLKGDIVASDPRNQGIIKSEVVEWRPQENLLLIKDNLQGIYTNVIVTATTGKYFTDIQSLELEDNVVATTEEPPLQLKSDRLKWNVAQNKIESPGAVNIVRYDKLERVTDKLVSDRATLDLANHLATLEGNIELISLQPKLQAATDFFTWNYQSRQGKTDRPIQIVDRDRQIDLTGNQGEIDLQQQLAKLTGGVRGINQQQPAELYARQLIWKIDTEKVEATGNIIYEQSDPPARLTGEKAVGTLGNNNIVVTSDGKKQVTTTIDNR